MKDEDSPIEDEDRLEDPELDEDSIDDLSNMDRYAPRPPAPNRGKPGKSVNKRCPWHCPRNIRRVCGSNGKTYINSCALRRVTCRNSKIHKAHNGRCKTKNHKKKQRKCKTNKCTRQVRRLAAINRRYTKTWRSMKHQLKRLEYLDRSSRRSWKSLRSCIGGKGSKANKGPRKCRDNPRVAKKCGKWAHKFCNSKKYRGYMSRNCKKTCKKCRTKKCRNKNKNCGRWARNFCNSRSAYQKRWMGRNCRKSCGKCGTKRPRGCRDNKKKCAWLVNSRNHGCNPRNWRRRRWMNRNCRKSCRKCRTKVHHR